MLRATVCAVIYSAEAKVTAESLRVESAFMHRSFSSFLVDLLLQFECPLVVLLRLLLQSLRESLVSAPLSGLLLLLLLQSPRESLVSGGIRIRRIACQLPCR